MLAITGATGQLGGRVARRLAAAGVAQRLLVRDRARAPQLAHGAAPAATFTLARDHWMTEQHIRARGITFTFLRQLYADFFPQMTGDDGVIRGPAGDGRAAAVVQDDIADAAVAVTRGYPPTPRSPTGPLPVSRARYPI